ncbi:MAG: hypothetical protein J3Q66DRAFT_396894 [Benniella sp.]|nr:MAG: hypothetical protein J3Q66DRAFT_396894 [Benniella sp.]
MHKLKPSGHYLKRKTRIPIFTTTLSPSSIALSDQAGPGVLRLNQVGQDRRRLTHLTTGSSPTFTSSPKAATPSCVKTSLEMKDAIDHGLALRKRLTTVFGCQVKDGKGELFRMELKFESVYLMKLVGSFVHPEGKKNDMTRVLLHNVPLLLWLSRELATTIETMDQDGWGFQKWVRPSSSYHASSGAFMKDFTVDRIRSHFFLQV